MSANATGGAWREAALIEMMFGAFQRLSPDDIISADDPELTQKNRAKRLWENVAIRQATVASIVDSTRLLARMWETAWIAGGGDNLPDTAIQKYSEASFNSVCRTEHDTFIPSQSLDQMAADGGFEP